MLEQWAAINGINEERDTSQGDFGDRLEGFEEERAGQGGVLLKELLHALVDIAYILPGEVERLIEGGKCTALSCVKLRKGEPTGYMARCRLAWSGAWWHACLRILVCVCVCGTLSN